MELGLTIGDFFVRTGSQCVGPCIPTIVTADIATAWEVADQVVSSRPNPGSLGTWTSNIKRCKECAAAVGPNASSLVAEFEASGLRQVEFCWQHGLSLTTLGRSRKRRQTQAEPSAANRLAVELCNARPVLETGAGPSGLALALARGRKIEVGRGGPSQWTGLAVVVHLLQRQPALTSGAELTEKG
jgi:hypothetical protein